MPFLLSFSSFEICARARAATIIYEVRKLIDANRSRIIVQSADIYLICTHNPATEASTLLCSALCSILLGLPEWSHSICENNIICITYRHTVLMLLAAQCSLFCIEIHPFFSSPILPFNCCAFFSFLSRDHQFKWMEIFIAERPSAINFIFIISSHSHVRLLFHFQYKFSFSVLFISSFRSFFGQSLFHTLLPNFILPSAMWLEWMYVCECLM